MIERDDIWEPIGKQNKYLLYIKRGVVFESAVFTSATYNSDYSGENIYRTLYFNPSL